MGLFIIIIYLWRFKMFDINDKETIIKIINQRSDNEYVIPLYVKIYNKTYSILELDSIKDFNQSSFKVGFGTASSMFMKNSFPNQYAFDFETMSVFKEFDQTYNTEIRYVVFETSMVDQISELHEQIDRYILMLEEYVGEHVQQIKKELMKVLLP